MLDRALLVIAGLAALVVLLGAVALALMFLDSADSSDRVAGVGIVVVGVVWAGVVAVGGYCVFHDHVVVGRVVLGVHVAIDVGLVGLLVASIEAAARP